jgi:hypothetical protein
MEVSLKIYKFIAEIRDQTAKFWSFVSGSFKNKFPWGYSKIQIIKSNFHYFTIEERGDVPGWVLVVLMTTGLVTGIWTVAQPRLSSILKNSLDNMNSIR